MSEKTPEVWESCRNYCVMYGTEIWEPFSTAKTQHKYFMRSVNRVGMDMQAHIQADHFNSETTVRFSILFRIAIYTKICRTGLILITACPIYVVHHMKLKSNFTNVSQVAHHINYIEQIKDLITIYIFYTKQLSICCMFLTKQYKSNISSSNGLVMLVPVTTALCVLGIRMEETASKYGG
jgi:hypothetical protein